MSATRILVVDDEQLIRWCLRERLREAGHQVIEARDGREALDRVEDHVDLLLLDLKLPDRDGLGVLKEIRGRGFDAPVIIMTAYGTPEVVDEAHRLGAYGVVDKPFRYDELLTLVSEVLASRSG